MSFDQLDSRVGHCQVLGVRSTFGTARGDGIQSGRRRETINECHQFKSKEFSLPYLYVPCKVDGEFLGHVDDVSLGAEFVVVGEDILEVDVVLVQQRLHPRPLVRCHANAQRTEHVCHNLEYAYLTINVQFLYRPR